MPDDQPYMGSWFLRFDRFADVHVVAAQSKNQSCGLAAIKMVIFKVNKLRPGAATMKTEQLIEDRYRALANEQTHDFDVAGSSPSVMVKVLNSFGVGTWAIDKPAVADVGTKIA